MIGWLTDKAQTTISPRDLKFKARGLFRIRTELLRGISENLPQGTQGLKFVITSCEKRGPAGLH